MNTAIFEYYDSENGVVIKSGTADTLALYLGVSNSNIYARAKSNNRGRFVIRRSKQEIDYQTGTIIDKSETKDKLLDYLELMLVKCRNDNTTFSSDPEPYIPILLEKFGLVCEYETIYDVRLTKNCNVSSKRRHHGKFNKKGKPHYTIKVVKRNGLQNLHS